MKKFFALFLTLCFVFPLSGCYDNREIDQTAYVIAVGIDKGNNLYNYTFQISSPLAMGSGGEGGASGDGEENTRVENIIIGAADLYEARNMLNNFLSKRINLSHLKMIVFSSDIAREGLDSHMTFLLREREVRPNTRLCVSEKSAEDFLRGINPALEANTAEYYDLVSENGAIYAPPKTLREFVNEESLFASAVPLGRVSEFESSSDFTPDGTSLRISASKSEFSGLCLIKDYKSAGKLTPALSCIFGLLTGETEDADIVIQKGGKSYTVRLSPESTAKFTVSMTDEATTVNMAITFNAETNSSGDHISESEIEEYLEKEAYALFLTAQRAGCDIFGAGNFVRRRCKTVSEWEKLDWNKEFESAYFSPEITVISRRSNSGTM